jgi:hypothetical protein
MENKLTIKQAAELTGYSGAHLRRLAWSVRALTALDAQAGLFRQMERSDG